MGATLIIRAVRILFGLLLVAFLALYNPNIDFDSDVSAHYTSAVYCLKNLGSARRISLLLQKRSIRIKRPRLGFFSSCVSSMRRGGKAKEI